MSSKSIGLYLFCNTVEQVLLAEKAGVDGIMLDWESKGKDQRQQGYDTEINDLDYEALGTFRELTSKPIMVRINGLCEDSEREVELALSGGATQILLPMAQSADEVEQFIALVNGRAEPCIMIETQSLVDDIERLATLPWSSAFIGLNDLMITRTANSLWVPLLDGTVDQIYKALSGRQIGYGGITLIDKGHPLPFKMLLKEMARHGCSFSFLRRSFYRDIGDRDPNVECQKVRDHWQMYLQRSPEQQAHDHDVFQAHLGAMIDAN